MEKIEIIYGMTVVNPEMSCEIFMPKLTWREAISCALHEVWYVIVQAALFAGSVTSFAWGFGLIR